MLTSEFHAPLHPLLPRNRMKYGLTLVIALAFWAEAVCAEEHAAANAPRKSVVLKSYRHGRWLVQETKNFRVICLPDAKDVAKFPEVCEALRSQLQQAWFGKSLLEKFSANWSPRCDIVLYPTVAEYSRVLGPGSEQSSGCASLEMEKGRIVSRRVDLRADASDWLTASLPHELTHVVIADRFSRKQLPRWADEGMSILAEPEQKRARRYRELQNALAQRAVYQAADLVKIQTYPTAPYRDAFYGQSASLVAHLAEQGTPEKFLEFVELAMEQGYDHAVKEIYGIRSMAALQAQWQPRLYAREQPPVLLADGITQITSTMEAGRGAFAAGAIP